MSKLDDAAVRAELAELRAALATVAVPVVDDATLRARFRAAASGLPRAAEPRVTRGAARRYLAAAGVLLAVATGVLLALTRGTPPAAPVATAAAEPRPAMGSDGVPAVAELAGFFADGVVQRGARAHSARLVCRGARQRAKRLDRGGLARG